MLYLGSFVSATTLPWHYVPVWIIITTPIVYTFGFLIGCITSGAAILKEPFMFYTNHQKRNDAIFLSWFFLPLVAVIVLKSVVYDSWRQLFFVYPAFLLISLKGLESMFNIIKLKEFNLNILIIEFLAGNLNSLRIPSGKLKYLNTILSMHET